MRIRDPQVRVDQLIDEVLVRCPRCDGYARTLAHLGEPEIRPVPGGPTRIRRRLRCRACGYARDEYRGGWVTGAPVDPYFQLPLWLRAECCGGHLLWAYNLRHLALLESYIAATVRERGQDGPRVGSTLVARLPAWLKSAKHRDEVLRTLRRLRASVPDEAGRRPPRRHDGGQR